MTRKTNILLPRELTRRLDACMECERLKANSVTGPNTCTERFDVKYLQNKNISVFDAEGGGG